MKKILTTTVMTAILATNGFAEEPVGVMIYGCMIFEGGIDINETTIMPSGHVDAGGSGGDTVQPTIATKWTLKEGSVMTLSTGPLNVKGTLNINPRDAGAIPVQCNIKDDANLYYEYTDTNGKKVYKLVGSSENSYVTAAGKAATYSGDLTQTMTETVTGSPILTGNKYSSVLDMGACDGCACGKICGGTVTYATEGTGVFVKDTTELGETSLNGLTGGQFTISQASNSGFSEEYISKLPALGSSELLDLSDTSNYVSQLSDSETLKGYLNSFGFYPESVSVSHKIWFDLLTEKEETAAIKIPQSVEFSKDASEKEYKIKANLHNVGQSFTKALTFTGTNSPTSNFDTLVFSGDNRNLIPTQGVTYTDVNTTFCNANSWIAAPKGQSVIIQHSDNNFKKLVLTIEDNLSICHDLTISKNTSFVVGKNNAVKLFGTLTFK